MNIRIEPDITIVIKHEDLSAQKKHHSAHVYKRLIALKLKAVDGMHRRDREDCGDARDNRQPDCEEVSERRRGDHYRSTASS